MSDEPKRGRWWAGIIWTAMAVFVLYLLSIGPANRVAIEYDKYRGRRFNVVNDIDVVRSLPAVYEPIAWLRDRSETFRAASDWYIQLWHP
jgi:hypothetical protein